MSWQKSKSVFENKPGTMKVKVYFLLLVWNMKYLSSQSINLKDWNEKENMKKVVLLKLMWVKRKQNNFLEKYISTS